MTKARKGWEHGSSGRVLKNSKPLSLNKKRAHVIFMILIFSIFNMRPHKLTECRLSNSCLMEYVYAAVCVPVGLQLYL
jgi:hypothetical protein